MEEVAGGGLWRAAGAVGVGLADKAPGPMPLGGWPRACWEKEAGLMADSQMRVL